MNSGKPMDVIIVVDMQVGLRKGPQKYDLPGVIDRINSLTNAARERSGKVVWIRHCGTPGDDFAPNTPGWEFLPELDRRPDDVVVEKTLNDPFVETDLQAILQRIQADRVVVVGWATDFCVDSTVRSAVSHNYDVVVVSDGHTLNDRPHLDAPAVIGHHNWVWSGLITKRSIRVVSTAQLLEESEPLAKATS
jgi:nicotinamidase-related amidase